MPDARLQRTRAAYIDRSAEGQRRRSDAVFELLATGQALTTDWLIDQRRREFVTQQRTANHDA